jgi:hypothetical protein
MPLSKSFNIKKESKCSDGGIMKQGQPTTVNSADPGVFFLPAKSSDKNSVKLCPVKGEALKGL